MKNKEYSLLYILMVVISVIGIIMIYSASFTLALYKYNDAFKYVKNQLLFFLIGIIMVKIITKIDLNKIYKKANLLLLLAIILLILVIIPGIGIVRNGSRSWFGIGHFGIQPSEIAKLCLIIYIAKYLTNNKNNLKKIKIGVIPIVLIIVIFFGLIMLEPDFGTGMVLVMTSFILLFASGIKFSFFSKIGLLGILGIIVLILIAPYRLARIVSFLNPWSDPLGSGFQIIQSLYAIGPGGIFGLGFLKSRQKLFYLPEPQTDFIFSIISEEFGLLGIIVVLSIFLAMFIIGIKVALKESDLFKKYLAFGLSFLIIFQAMLNLAVVTGLLPVTGVTLPFLSYGGSSLLVSMASIGIILNIAKNSNTFT